MSQANAENSTSAPISRRAVEQQIDALIDLLDHLDTDPDLEPSLGFSSGGFCAEIHPQEGPGYHMNANTGDDTEDEHDGAEPPEDSEHSLGWTDNPNQFSPHWHANDSGDLEAGTGPVRKKRPQSKTGGDVYRGCGVLGVPPQKQSRVPTVLRVRPKVAR